MITIKNPIADGWYADPEARKYNGKYYIYVTQIKPFEEQKNLDMFSSSDLENWEKHENIICMEDFPHVKSCVWAPTVVEKNGKYYLIFASNTSCRPLTQYFPEYTSYGTAYKTPLRMLYIPYLQNSVYSFCLKTLLYGDEA